MFLGYTNVRGKLGINFRKPILGPDLTLDSYLKLCQLHRLRLRNLGKIPLEYFEKTGEYMVTGNWRNECNYSILNFNSRENIYSTKTHTATILNTRAIHLILVNIIKHFLVNQTKYHHQNKQPNIKFIFHPYAYSLLVICTRIFRWNL